MPKILVVDDDVRVLSLVRQQLLLEGFGAEEAQDVEEAWRSITADPPDAALIDITLRGELEGWSLVERIRSDAKFGRLPVVILTGRTDPQTRERAAEFGCEFVAKPFDLKGLWRGIRSALRNAIQVVAVEVLLGGYRVQGTVHLPAEPRRFSDAWEALLSGPDTMVRLTETRIATPDGTEVGRAPFMQVRKNAIEGVLPLE